MTIETTIDEHAKIRTHTIFGFFEFEVLYSALEDIYDDPEFDPELNSIWDLTEVGGIQLITPDQLKELVAYVSQERSTYGSIKTALVVSKKIDFGIAQVYKLSMKSESDNEVKVFMDLDEAIKWMKET